MEQVVQQTQIIKQKKIKKSASLGVFVSLSIIPTLILYTAFVIYPIINMFYLSTVKWNGFGDKVPYGIQNYLTLVKDSMFWKSTANMFIMILAVTAVTICLALFTAAILSKGKLKGKTFFRIVLYIPNILSIVVISAIFSALYSPEYGILGAIINMFHGEYLGVLGERKTAIIAICVAMVWQAVGYYMVMYIAGMDSISDSLYESADLEGASKARQFFKITLPLTWQVIRVTLTFFVISTINMSFLFITAMLGTGYTSPVHVLLTYMFERKSAGFYGYSMAIGTVLFVLAYGISLIINAITRKEVIEQ